MFYHRGHGEKKEHTDKARQLFYGERRFRRCTQMYADMKNGYAFALAALLAALCGTSGCRTVDESPVGKGVKTYEKYSDEIGRERDVKVFGKDVIIEPEADKKIRISF
jgi:hypothetical protein